MLSTTRLASLSALSCACALVVGCGSTTPTTPTTSSATVTALAIGAPPASLKAGDTFQLTATATLSNGQTATSGFTVTWASSDPDVASVSASGLVTAKADGKTTISAAANAVKASVEFLVRGGRTLTGIVTESAPTISVMVAGARVTVTDGLYAGASATTDARGAFSLPDVNGVVNLRISAPTFDDVQIAADTAAPGALTIRLVPSARTVTDADEWFVPWGDPRQTYQAAMTFSMHRPGRVDLATGGTVGAGESAPICSELRDDANKLIWEYKAYWQAPAQVTLSLDGGKQYTVKVNDCGWAGRPILNSYRMSATHPY